MLVVLLMGSLLFISSCTSNDARIVSSEEGDPLADITGEVVKDVDDLSDIEELDNDLDEILSLDLDDIEF